MTRVTVWDAWSVDVRSLPCGVTECTERRLIDTIEFDGDQMHFTEALEDAGCSLLASLRWVRGRTVSGRTEYTVTVDNWVTYLAEVVEDAQAVSVEREAVAA